MQTKLQKDFLNTAQGKEANSILRSCVHCGFCTATCPTYQLLGDELDSPRGRIYLIKQVLEGHAATEKTRTHLDRCLTCRACETTCPSGVRYSHLLEIGREVVENQVPRRPLAILQRLLLRKLIPYPRRLAPLLSLANLLRPLLPAEFRHQVPRPTRASQWPQQAQSRKMLVLGGCAQKVVSEETNVAAARILQKLGIELIDAPRAGCCGALSHHLSAINDSHHFIKLNIDAWWPAIEAGAEAIIVTASGCGVMVKDYAHIMQHDINYAEKAKRVSELACDLSEILQQNAALFESCQTRTVTPCKVSFHSPCTLQHGLQIDGVIENLLQQAGYQLLPVKDAHLCCGSAGTYSILQAELSNQLQSEKLQALEAHKPDVIATANIGCQMHLASATETPVRHWIELMDDALE